MVMHFFVFVFVFSVTSQDLMQRQLRQFVIEVFEFAAKDQKIELHMVELSLKDWFVR